MISKYYYNTIIILIIISGIGILLEDQVSQSLSEDEKFDQEKIISKKVSLEENQAKLVGYANVSKVIINSSFKLYYALLDTNFNFVVDSLSFENNRN